MHQYLLVDAVVRFKDASEMLQSRVESVGWMTRTVWVTWVTFLEGQVGFIRKLNYLDVTRISHVL